MKPMLTMAAFAMLAIFLLVACARPQPAGGNTATPSGGVTPTPAATATATLTSTLTPTGTLVMTATAVMTSTPAMTVTLTTTSTAGATSTTAGVVQVTLREYAIDMPNSLPTGATTFEVINQGTVMHSFTLEGQGLEKGLAQNLAPGEKSTLQVNLKAGTYTAYCPVDAHESKGMKVAFKVQ